MIGAGPVPARQAPAEPPVVTVGVADEQHSWPALSWAVDEAARRSARLDVVHAVHHALLDRSPHDYRAAVGRAAAQVQSSAWTRARQQAPDLAVRSCTVHGRAAPALLDAAARSAVLVLGTRGRGGVTGLSLGSTSSWVTARSRGPVVLVRDLPDTFASGVVAGVDGSPESATAALLAARRARDTGEELTLVHVWDALDTYPDLRSRVSRETTVWFRDLHERILERSAAVVRSAFPDVRLHCRLVDGPSIASALLGEVSTARLLAIGVRGRSGSSGAVLGPVTRAVLHRSRLPVLVAGRPSDVVDDHVVPEDLGAELDPDPTLHAPL